MHTSPGVNEFFNMNYMETDYQPNEFSLLSVLLIDMREYTFKQSTTN